jgi:glycosyltransferase involved in cell wall biosynthesis
LVNARWSEGLLRSGEYDVTGYPPETTFGTALHLHPEDASETPDFLIHHDFESHFGEFVPPEGVFCIAVRTWDFGPLPGAWARKINEGFHQLWTYTHWIARQAEAGGVRPDRIRVVPLGADPNAFRPEGDAYPLPMRGRFAFLFVGGVSPRKGTDILLEAYARAFTPEDEVVLVIKDHSADLFYRENTIRKRIVELIDDPHAPEILHIDRFLSDLELAALYRACDVAVFPYRAEGFCLPILEAMACGTPPIVPNFGACLDFCSEETSYLMPVRRIHVPVFDRFRVALGFEEDVDEVDFCEVPVDTLATWLRRTYDASASERQGKGSAGTAVAHGRFTWDHSVERVRRNLEELRHGGV